MFQIEDVNPFSSAKETKSDKINESSTLHIYWMYKMGNPPELLVTFL